MIWAHMIALLLDLAGLTCAAAGFAQTWNQHGTGELWAPWRARLRGGVRRAWSWVTGRLRRRRPDVWPHDSRTDEEPLDYDGPAVPGGAAQPAAPDFWSFAAVLQSRVDGLTNQVVRLEAELRAERRRQELAVRGVHTHLVTEVGRVEELTRDVAVGGLRLQILGWTLVLAGVVVSGVLDIIGAATQ